ncbi:MAG: hypothetical protein HY796_04780 [Elusimicrobia bacterium]|nr:hypothetical protein [Elusimicrobiota bacterium]
MKKKTALLCTVLTLLVNMPYTAAAMETDNNKMVVLPVTIKDPERAYSLSLIPISGPFAAHRYLSSSPIRWGETISEVHNYAILTSVLNVVTIGAGIYLMATAYEETTETYNYGYGSYSYPVEKLNPGKFFGGFALILFGPIIENVIFGNYAAKQAVEYNKRLYKQFNYQGEPFSFQFKVYPGKTMLVMTKRF